MWPRQKILAVLDTAQDQPATDQGGPRIYTRIYVHTRGGCCVRSRSKLVISTRGSSVCVTCIADVKESFEDQADAGARKGDTSVGDCSLPGDFKHTRPC